MRNLFIRILLPGLLVLLPGPALAEVQGLATVVDGDTVVVGGERLHLDGIDAPEAEQQCEHYGMLWPCGAEARTVLQRIIDRRPLSCRKRDRDSEGAAIADCRIGVVGLSLEMLSTGMAVTLPGAGPSYTDAEAAARDAKRGLWAGRFVPPADWRRGVRLAPLPAAQRCRIKGDIGPDGRRLYYPPNHPGYDQVKIDPSAGERWFCTEVEAMEAGWKLAQ